MAPPEVSQYVTRVMQAIATAEETDEAEVISAETSEEDEAEMLGVLPQKKSIKLKAQGISPRRM